MKISRFFKLFKISTPANNLSKADPRLLRDIGIASPYAIAYSLRSPFEVGNDRI